MTEKREIHKGYFYQIALEELKMLFAKHVHNIRHNAQFPSALTLHEDFTRETRTRIPLSQFHSLSSKYYEPDLTVTEMKAVINFIRDKAKDHSSFLPKLQKNFFGKDVIVVAMPLTESFSDAGVNADDFASRAQKALAKLAEKMTNEAAKNGPIAQAAQEGLK